MDFTRYHPVVFLVPVATVTMAVLPLLAIVILTQVYGDLVGTLVGVGIFWFGWFLAEYFGDWLKRQHARAEHERRLKPIKELLETCRLMPDQKEIEYRCKLVRQIFKSLAVPAKPEAPLPSGTHVDAYMRFGDEDWYITIKRGLDNQKRLILQGEIEDIVLHAPHQTGRLWIWVIVGVRDTRDPTEMWHFAKLCEYAAYRSTLSAEQQVGRFVNIEVMEATIPSC